MTRQARALAKLRAEKLRDDDRHALRALRQRIRLARARRVKALTAASKRCRRARLQTRDFIRQFRADELRRIAAEMATMRLAARNQCQARKHRIRTAGGSAIERERAKLREEKRLQAQLHRLTAAAALKKRKFATSAEQRRQESDDEVRNNLPRDLVLVYDQVRKQIKGGPRTTRTEAFLQWAEENPGDVLVYQQHAADVEVRRLVAEHEKVSSRLRKGKRHYREMAEALDVPF